jgi:hypothetical protein
VNVIKDKKTVDLKRKREIPFCWTFMVRNWTVSGGGICLSKDVTFPGFVIRILVES